MTIGKILRCCSIKEYVGMNKDDWKPRYVFEDLCSIKKEYLCVPGHLICSIATSEGEKHWGFEEGPYSVRYFPERAARRMQRLKRFFEFLKIGTVTLTEPSQNNNYGPDRKVQVAIIQIHRENFLSLYNKQKQQKAKPTVVFDAPEAAAIQQQRAAVPLPGLGNAWPRQLGGHYRQLGGHYRQFGGIWQR